MSKNKARRGRNADTTVEAPWFKKRRLANRVRNKQQKASRKKNR